MRLYPLLLPLVACSDPEADCDTMARASVAVTLTSSTGAPLEEVVLQYTGPDDEEPRACDPLDDAWVCGWEVPGDLLIEAMAACHGAASQTVTVPEGACHVEQQSLQLTLDPVDCTAEEVPSVFVTVSDEGGLPIEEAHVGFVPEGQDWTDYQPCDAMDGGWACGWGYSGGIDLEVTAYGYSPWWGQAEVAEDCCGPVTERVDVVLPETPDQGG
ncbi:MAG: hypothetical protein ABIO70_00385 [Pseudomonadota bacterium]